MPNVVDRLAWCFEQSQKSGFATRLVREVRVRGIRLIRWHISGDVYDAEYASKMLCAMRRLPRVRFWFYTRSWRVQMIEGVLRQMALLDNCKVWFSLDRDTGFPADRPPNVRYAFMQVLDEPVPQGVNLVFRTRRALNFPRIALPTICPSDTPAGRKAGANCGCCGLCFAD